MGVGARQTTLPSPLQSDIARFAKEDLINPGPRVFEEAGVPPPWVSSVEPPSDGGDAEAALLQADGAGVALIQR